MDFEKKWFYLSASLTAVMTGYILTDLYIKFKKANKKKLDKKLS
jgi:hypothetical protein